jgi:preprotein translocase subunit SecB
MAEEKQKGNEKRIAVAKIYVKDFSFESPQAPQIFKSDKWSPQTNLNLRSSHSKIDEGVHEVVLTITVDAKDGDKTVFLVEIQQAGLFELTGYDDTERAAITGSYCPGILFPYAREAVASTIQRGGFPEFVLQPINFDALYMQSQKQAAAAAATSEEKH